MDVLAAIETAAGLAPGTLTRSDVELVAQEGDIDWVVVRLPDGRWAATDDAEIAPDRVAISPTREAALRFQWEGWLAAHPDYRPEDATERFGWRAPVPPPAAGWMTLPEAAARWGVAIPTLRKRAERGGFPEGHARKSGHLWLVSDSGMRACYGPPRA